MEIPYNWQPPRERTTLPEMVLEDFEVRIARDLLLRGSGTRRSQMISELPTLAKDATLGDPPQ